MAVVQPDVIVATEGMHHILTAGAQQFQKDMTDIGANVAVSHNLARLGATQRFNEVDLIEGRTASGILSTPIASPSTQSE